MKALRRLALTALVIAFLQIVFGAIVRITGSGMGCGDHWPKCNGRWIPPLDHYTEIIEVTHRWLALAVGIPIVLLVVFAWRRRGSQAGVAGPHGVLRSAVLALGLYAIIANVGRIIVQTGLHSLIVAAHLVLAMSLLATLATALVRAGGLGALAAARQKISPGTRKSAFAAAGLGAAVIAMGALTANMPGAASACLGFPFCTQSYITTNGAAHVQITHRVLAVLLLLHLFGMMMAMRKRGEVGAVTTAVKATLGVVVLQILVAAALVTMTLPKALQSLHQAVGTLVWLAVFVLALFTRRAGVRESETAAPTPEPGARSDDPRKGRVRTPSRTPQRPQTPVGSAAPTAAQATIAFVATTGPNARLVRIDPGDDAGFAAAEAGGMEEPPPADDPMPDVPALAETGSWSLADLSIGMPPDADEHLRDDEAPEGPRDPKRDDDGHGSGGGASALAVPLVAAALLAHPGVAQANAVESHDSVAVHDVPAVVTPPSVSSLVAYTLEEESTARAFNTEVTEVTEARTGEISSEKNPENFALAIVAPVEDLDATPSVPSVSSVLNALSEPNATMTPATPKKRPPSLAVIIARGAMS